MGFGKFVSKAREALIKKYPELEEQIRGANVIFGNKYPGDKAFVAEKLAQREANKAIKAEEARKRTLFGGEIEQQLREKKYLLGEAEDPEEKARKEFLRRKLLGM